LHVFRRVDSFVETEHLVVHHWLQAIEFHSDQTWVRGYFKNNGLDEALRSLVRLRPTPRWLPGEARLLGDLIRPRTHRLWSVRL
jgi:hypothetical protein